MITSNWKPHRMDHGNESGGVYAAEKIIKKRFRKVNENDAKQSTKSTKSISFHYWIDSTVNVKSNTASKSRQCK